VRSCRPKLVMITDSYPFGSVEQPFVEPEIRAFFEGWDVAIVPMGSSRTLNPACSRKVLSQVQVLLPRIPWNSAAKARYGLLAAALPMLWQEVRHCSPMQAKTAWAYLSKALWARSVFKDLGLLNPLGRTLFYSFWLNPSALALALLRQDGGVDHLVSRTNGYDLYNHRIPAGRQPFRIQMKNNIDRILFSCQVGRDYFCRTFGPEATPGQYQLARLGCSDHSAFERDGAGKFTVMSCSSVIPLKRVRLLAEGIALVGRDSIRWIHAGDGPELEEVRAFAERESLDATFLGNVPNDLLMNFYSNTPIDLFATMSSSEGGCPVSVTEALSFSMPILASRAGGGVVEQVDASNGILLGDNPSAREVAGALTLFLEMGRGCLAAMGCSSHKKWDRYFDVRKTTSRTVGLMEGLLEQ